MTTRLFNFQTPATLIWSSVTVRCHTLRVNYENDGLKQRHVYVIWIGLILHWSRGILLNRYSMYAISVRLFTTVYLFWKEKLIEVIWIARIFTPSYSYWSLIEKSVLERYDFRIIHCTDTLGRAVTYWVMFKELWYIRMDKFLIKFEYLKVGDSFALSMTGLLAD